MKKLIIFDFNKTLYHPVSRRLVEDALFVLESLHTSGHTLALLSTHSHSREQLVESLNIKPFFSHIVFTPQKTEQEVLDIVDTFHIDISDCVLVGDSSDEEIMIGTRLGITTIWIPYQPSSSPYPSTYMVEKLRDILPILS